MYRTSPLQPRIILSHLRVFGKGFLEKRTNFLFYFLHFVKARIFCARCTIRRLFCRWKTPLPRFCRGSMDGFAADYTYYTRGSGLTLSVTSCQLSQREGANPCWVFVKQFSRNDTATALSGLVTSTRLGRGSIKSHVCTVKVLGMGLFAFQERVRLWQGVTH